MVARWGGTEARCEPICPECCRSARKRGHECGRGVGGHRSVGAFHEVCHDLLYYMSYPHYCNMQTDKLDVEAFRDDALAKLKAGEGLLGADGAFTPCNVSENFSVKSSPLIYESSPSTATPDSASSRF